MNKAIYSTLRYFSYILSALFVIFFLFLVIQNDSESSVYLLFTTTYGAIPLLGFVYAVVISQVWGGWKSIIGKSIILFGIALGLQFAGQLTYTYYLHVLQTEPPYPSFAEVFYLSSVFMYLYGIYLLAKLSQVKESMKTLGFKIFATIVAIVLFVIAYGIFYSSHDWSDNSLLLIIIELLYPLGQGTFIGLTIFTLYSIRNLYGGKVIYSVTAILISLFFLYLADSLFLWIPTLLSDGLYLVSYIIMMLAILFFEGVYQSVSDKTNNGQQ